jgi:hypothetical protein
VIIAGQNVLAAAADKRSEATYYDADAVLHEAVKIQEQPRGTCSPRRPEPVGPAPPGAMPTTGLRFPNGAQCTTKYLTPYSPPNMVARQATEDAQIGPIYATLPGELAIDGGNRVGVIRRPRPTDRACRRWRPGRRR